MHIYIYIHIHTCIHTHTHDTHTHTRAHMSDVCATLCLSSTYMHESACIAVNFIDVSSSSAAALFVASADNNNLCYYLQVSLIVLFSGILVSLYIPHFYTTVIGVGSYRLRVCLT